MADIPIKFMGKGSFRTMWYSNIPTIRETAHDDTVVEWVVAALGKVVRGHQKQSQAGPTVQTQDIPGIEFPNF